MERFLRSALALVSAAAILLFAVLAAMRVPYPLELDYIEGALMDHIVRLAQGRPIYVAPTLEFIPLAYMPGFATLTSLLARLFGPHFWEPRLISVLAMLGTAWLVGRVVTAETDRPLLGLTAAGVLLGSFGISGSHYDVGRPDSLMLFLAFSGLATLRFTTGLLGALAAALLLTLAFFTKQHAVWFAIGALVHLALNDRWRLVPFGAAVIAGCAGGYALPSQWLGPWFSFFTWDVPSHWSQISRERILNYLGGGLLGKLGVFSVASILALALPVQFWRGRTGLWTWVGVAGVATGLMATLDPDAFRHTLNPSVVAFSILGPIALLHVIRHLAAWPDSGRPGRSWVLYALLLLQFVPLVYSVRNQRPHPRAREAHAALLARLRAYPGPVLMLYHGHYAWQAGKGTSLQQIALDDILRARGNRLLRDDPGYFDRMFQALREGPGRPMIVTDIELARSGLESRPLWESVAPHYRLEGDLGWISETMNPINGHHWKPRFLYVPLEEAGVASGGASPASDSTVSAAR